MDWHERDRMAEEALADARYTTTTGFARADCPFCIEAKGSADHKSGLAINIHSGWYRCWRCQTWGRIDRPDDVAPAAARAATTDMQPPDGFLPLCEEPARTALSAWPARRYLESRGLGAGTWKAAGIGCCLTGRWQNRVVVPVLSPAGEWWGWVSRLWSREASDPYRTAPGMVLGEHVFNHSALMVETDEPAIAVEGCFDALPYWPDGVAMLGKPKAPQVLALIEARRPVAVCLDGDAWEEAEMLALRLQFEGQRAGFVRLPPREDPNSVDPTWLREEARRCL